MPFKAGDLFWSPGWLWEGPYGRGEEVTLLRGPRASWVRAGAVLLYRHKPGGCGEAENEWQ